MSKQFNKFLIKILVLSTLMVLVFNVGDNILNADTIQVSTISKNDNNSNFKKLNPSTLGKTGVAITTNIGIRYKQRQEVPATIYKDIFSINEIIADRQLANKELVGVNMLTLQEYRSVLKTNIKQLLDTSYDKPKMFNALIEQLQYRYVMGAENMKTLSEQKAVFEKSMNDANTKIDALKQKIDTDFKSYNSTESLANINSYLDLKKEYYFARTYIVYINQFLSEYDYLNGYNKLLLDTLINNREAILKNATVVIPDSGTGLLKNFDLLFTEEEYKTQQK
ncbi:MAG: hypothetical protein PHS49_08240 [Candidatus Gracilibacteria bacterium]|nr:hypothetical protein [Candidatus Gracilibacteria bacterium]